jgi:hypothetical protein
VTRFQSIITSQKGKERDCFSSFSQFNHKGQLCSRFVVFFPSQTLNPRQRPAPPQKPDRAQTSFGRVPFFSRLQLLGTHSSLLPLSLLLVNSNLLHFPLALLLLSLLSHLITAGEVNSLTVFVSRKAREKSVDIFSPKS